MQLCLSGRKIKTDKPFFNRDMINGKMKNIDTQSVDGVFLTQKNSFNDCRDVASQPLYTISISRSNHRYRKIERIIKIY